MVVWFLWFGFVSDVVRVFGLVVGGLGEFVGFGLGELFRVCELMCIPAI